MIHNYLSIGISHIAQYDLERSYNVGSKEHTACIIVKHDTVGETPAKGGKGIVL